MPEVSLAPQAFRATRWSLVLQSRGAGPEARRALEDLCQIYWFPLYAWCRRYGLGASDAEDIVQGFFMRILEKRLFESADANRGKLRSFLLTALQRHVKDETGKSLAGKRGSGKVISFDSVEAEQWYVGQHLEGESADHLYDRQWALTILNNAVRRLDDQAKAGKRQTAFSAMRPFLTREGSNDDYASAGAQIGMKLETFRVGVHRLRLKFREALRIEVAETQPVGSSIEEEITYLMRVLGEV